VIAVRVRYTKDGHGYRYVVLAASGALTWLGSGWSAGRRRDAEQSFRAQAMAMGWIDHDMRTARMRSAA
jgi:hypothetical protein